MKTSIITEIQFEILINKNLYQKKIIDEDTYLEVNEKLLKLLKQHSIFYP